MLEASNKRLKRVSLISVLSINNNNQIFSFDIRVWFCFIPCQWFKLTLNKINSMTFSFSRFPLLSSRSRPAVRLFWLEDPDTKPRRVIGSGRHKVPPLDAGKGLASLPGHEPLTNNNSQVVSPLVSVPPSVYFIFSLPGLCALLLFLLWFSGDVHFLQRGVVCLSLRHHDKYTTASDRPPSQITKYNNEIVKLSWQRQFPALCAFTFFFLTKRLTFRNPFHCILFRYFQYKSQNLKTIAVFFRT